jgi:hypothetical protein
MLSGWFPTTTSPWLFTAELYLHQLSISRLGSWVNSSPIDFLVETSCQYNIGLKLRSASSIVGQAYAEEQLLLNLNTYWNKV